MLYASWHILCPEISVSRICNKLEADRYKHFKTHFMFECSTINCILLFMVICTVVRCLFRNKLPCSSQEYYWEIMLSEADLQFSSSSMPRDAISLILICLLTFDYNSSIFKSMCLMEKMYMWTSPPTQETNVKPESNVWTSQPLKVQNDKRNWKYSYHYCSF